LHHWIHHHDCHVPNTRRLPPRWDLVSLQLASLRD
jgi:hypothetical protein